MTAGAEKSHLYGRRKGKKLTAYRQRLVEELLPRLRLPVKPGEKLDPQALFGRPVKGLWLEVGFGKGEHLAWQARHNPDIGFIGCEPFINGVAGLLGDIDEDKLGNIRIHDDDARAVIDALPDAALDRVFVLHPDPWPKLRHAKRRFINSDTLDALARVMKDGAELRVGTDDQGYSAWTVMQLGRRADFVWTAERAADWTARPADWPQTRYEAKALREGRHAVYLRYRREARAAA